MSGRERAVVVVALVVWVVLGQVGGFVPVGAPQNLLWAFSSVGMLVASPLLMLRFARERRDLAASGHALLTVCAMMLYAGGLISTPGGQVSFAAAIFFYAPALLLIGAEAGHPLVARVLGALAAIPFATFGILALAGIVPSERDQMFVNAGGYVLMTAAVIGWIVGLVRMPKAAASVAVLPVTG